LPLTKHSGRAAVAARLKHLGFKMGEADVAAIFARFKEIGDKKKFVYDDDLDRAGGRTKSPKCRKHGRWIT
jgi:2-isopropylmalate synthase